MENKVCFYCGSNIDAKGTILKDRYVCSKCFDIERLELFVKNFDRAKHSVLLNDEEFNKRETTKTITTETETVNVHSVSYKETIVCEKRSNETDEIIKLLDKGNKLLCMDINTQFEILDSILVKQLPFWKESGNLQFYIFVSTFSFCVLKVEEFFSEESRFSIKKIINRIEKNKKQIFKNEKCKIKIEFNDKQSKLYDYNNIDIDSYLTRVKDVLFKYNNDLKDLKSFRDKQCAHIDNLNDKTFNMNYYKLKRLFNLCKVIYNELFYIIAPDKHTNISFDANIWFSRLDYLVMTGKNQVEKEHKQNQDALNELLGAD